MSSFSTVFPTTLLPSGSRATRGWRSPAHPATKGADGTPAQHRRGSSRMSVGARRWRFDRDDRTSPTMPVALSLLLCSRDTNQLMKGLYQSTRFHCLFLLHPVDGLLVLGGLGGGDGLAVWGGAADSQQSRPGFLGARDREVWRARRQRRWRRSADRCAQQDRGVSSGEGAPRPPRSPQVKQTPRHHPHQLHIPRRPRRRCRRTGGRCRRHGGEVPSHSVRHAEWDAADGACRAAQGNQPPAASASV